jgi:calcineurin-like phosphoesterase
MNRWVLFLSLFFVTAAKAQQPAAVETVTKETVLIKPANYNFGKILQGRPVTHIFEIENTGTEPLRLENVQASCGCTTPEWSFDPIAPGTSGTIKVGYNAAAEGSFEKTVTVIYNGKQTKVLTISGQVYKAVSTSAPVNASISLLKQIQNHTN